MAVCARHINPKTPVDSSKKRTPWQIQRAVIFALVMRELKARFDGHWTGIVWMFGEPLLQLMAMVAINIYFRGRGGGESYDYAIMLVIAMIPFRLCTGLWTQLMSACKANKGLFNYRQVKPLDALMARALVEVILDVFMFILTMLLLARLGYQPAWPVNPLGYMMVWGGFFLLGTGMGLFFATIGGLVPKLSVVISLSSMPLMIFSGVLIPLHGVPLMYLEWVEIFNPIVHLAQYARSTYIEGYPVLHGVNVWVPLYYTLTFWAFGMALYRLRRVKMAAGE